MKSTEHGMSVEESGAEFEPGPKPEKNGSQFLSQDQQAVMHRISEAIAMLVYSEEANKPIVKMAMQGTHGVVGAVQMILAKVVQSAKPGIPRELIPLAAISALVLIQDFLQSVGEGDIDYREVIPALIDQLSRQFDVNRAEQLSLRKLKGKFLRRQQTDTAAEAGPLGVAADAAQEEAEANVEEEEAPPGQSPVDEEEGY